MKRLSVLVALLMLALMAVPANAAPKGDARDPDVGKKLWNFTVIAHPSGDWSADDDVCPNNGNRIFFEEGNGNTLGTIRWHLEPNNNPDFDITDCDGTYDGDADVFANESLRFWVMIKLVGPKTSALNVVCQDVVVSDNQDDLCVYSGGITRNSTTKIFSNLVDNEYEEVLWSLSGDWKVFQVLVYERL